MLGFNKKSARVRWRHPTEKRVAVIYILKQQAAFAVVYTDPLVETLNGLFDHDSVHAFDGATGQPVSCKLLAKSSSYKAMLLVAERVDAFFEVSTGNSRS